MDVKAFGDYGVRPRMVPYPSGGSLDGNREMTRPTNVVIEHVLRRVQGLLLVLQTTVSL